MAAVGPYGIEQFDAPGVIGAYQTVQGNRLKLMMEQKQLENLERTSAIQQGTMKALQAYATANAPKASQAAPDVSGSAPAATATAAPAPATPSAAPAAPDADARAQLFNTLIAIDPEKAGQVVDAFSKMDKVQLDAVQARNLHFAQTAAGILQLPQNERAAAIAKVAPDLGLTPQQVANFVPTDENLRRIVAEGMDVERIAQFSQPKVVPVTQGGSLESVSPTGATTTVYESPTITGPNGTIYQRPPAMSGTMPTVATPEEAMKLPAGTRFKLPDGRIGTVPGGAGGNASGGFQ